MAKKNILIGAGIVSLAGLFAALTMLGFNIVSDGDHVCAGSPEDPCISLINITNPTATTVYVYNPGQIRLSFSPEIASYQLYIKYKGKWLDMNFTNETKLPGVKSAKYVLKFSPYSTTEFKLVGYKKNPALDVKWSLFTDKGMLDPSWNASGNITSNTPDLEPDNAYYNSLLNCSVYANFSNASVSNPFQVIFYFFKNGVEQTDYRQISDAYNTSVHDVYTTTSVNETLVKNDSWVCKVRYFTTNDTIPIIYSDLYESNATIINNSLPSISAISPSNQSVVSISNNYPATIAWTATDGDNDTMNTYVYLGNATVQTLYGNTTSNSLQISNATNTSLIYYWYITIADTTGNTTTGLYNFNVSFTNWSIDYVNATSFLIKPTSSTGTFYPENQTNTTGIFLVHNYENASLNLSVNLSKGLPRFIDLYIIGFNLTNPLCYQESANVSTTCGAGGSGSYGFSEVGLTTPDHGNFTDGNWNTGTAAPLGGTDAFPNTLTVTSTFYKYCANTETDIGTYLVRTSNATNQATNYSLTLPTACANRNPLILLTSTTTKTNNNQTSVQCYNGSAYPTIQTISGNSHYIYEDAMNWSTACKLQKNSIIEKSNSYSRFNDSALNKTKAFNATRSNQTYGLQRTYKYLNMSSASIQLYGQINTSLYATSEVKFYANETLIYDLIPSTEGFNTSMPNLTLTNNATATLCGDLQYNIVNLTNSTITVCSYTNTTTGWIKIQANEFYAINSTINGTKKGMTGGTGGARGDRSVGGPQSGYGGQGGLSDWSTSCNGNTGANGGIWVASSKFKVGAGGGAGGSGGLLEQSPAEYGGTGGNAWYGPQAYGGGGGSVGCIVTDNSTQNARPRMGGGAGGGGGGGAVYDYTGGSTYGNAGANGEQGGAGILLYFQNSKTKNFTIESNGGNGGAGGGACGILGCGGGGGGQGASGGEIIIVSTGTLNMSQGKIDSKGGNGGAGGGGSSDGGAAGGQGYAGTGGRIKVFYVSLQEFSPSLNVSNGTGAYSAKQGSTFNNSNSQTISITKDLDITSTFNIFLATCPEIGNTHTCSMLLRMEGIDINATLRNFNASQQATNGATTMTKVYTIPANTSAYIWAKTIYNNSNLGASFNFTWQADK